ncbi:MAG: helix-turn-helix domain-containing protein [Lachnospiraceae bacterium]|nr:helix-turn-helix domain-containing protein [Lachnospiraceae bacterium]MCD8363752.1 helix-turn-helix domain-containing protein [Lachnospiraceae bacterium]
MDKATINSVSQNIKKYRILNKMTQEQLAERMNLDTQYYAQLERGERNFTLEKIILACSIFHVGIEDIVVLPQVERPDNAQAIQQLIPRLETLSTSQLLLVEKFITEVLPYVK